MLKNKKFDIFGFELYAKPLIEILNRSVYFSTITKFPKIEREVNFVVKKTLDSEEIINLIKKSGKGLIKSINPVNLYTHDSLGIDKKSIVFKMIFQSESKTLVDVEVNSIIENIIKEVIGKFEAKLRT